MSNKVKSYLKGLPKRYFIDAFTGMAQGLFVTLIAGTIIKTIGERVFPGTAVGNILIYLGCIAGGAVASFCFNILCEKIRSKADGE